jgi:multidrug transporter EmrE-like cation transporter
MTGGILYLWALSYPSGIGEAIVLVIGWIALLIAIATDLVGRVSSFTKTTGNSRSIPISTDSRIRKYGFISLALALLGIAVAIFTNVFNGGGYAVLLLISRRLFSPATFLQNWLGAYEVPIYVFVFATWFAVSYAVLMLIWFVRCKSQKTGRE